MANVKGRPPKPASIKLLEGNPGKRDVPREPQPLYGVPRIPPSLDEIGLQAWQRMVDAIGHTGTLTQAEWALMEVFADTWSKYTQARDQVNRLGIALVTRNKDGAPEAKRNPFASELHRYRDALIKLMVELGLTPIARARMGMANDEEFDPAAEFIA